MNINRVDTGNQDKIPADYYNGQNDRFIFGHLSSKTEKLAF